MEGIVIKIKDMKLIIVNWLPWTWKTTLAKRLFKELNIPCFIKDEFKEILYDEIWYTTVEQKKKFDITALKNIYNICEKHFQSKTSLIIEANFYSEFSTPIFNDLKSQYDFDIIQILCKTDWKTLTQRFIERDKSWARHPWHFDPNIGLNLEKWEPLFIKWDWEKLYIWWMYIELDTTNFELIDYKKLDENING